MIEDFKKLLKSKITMTFLEIILIISIIALLFAGYMSIGALIVLYGAKIPNRWLRIAAVIFWPITLVFLAVISPFLWLHEIFNNEY